MIAARWGLEKSVRQLLKSGASASIKNEYGQTARDIAADYRQNRVADILGKKARKK